MSFMKSMIMMCYLNDKTAEIQGISFFINV